jgi:hypothetical protein
MDRSEDEMSQIHVFNPDHNLVCEDCGSGELSGDHGIIAIVQGQQIYENDEIAQMYAETDIEWYHED